MSKNIRALLIPKINKRMFVYYYHGKMWYWDFLDNVVARARTTKILRMLAGLRRHHGRECPCRYPLGVFPV